MKNNIMRFTKLAMLVLLGSAAKEAIGYSSIYFNNKTGYTITLSPIEMKDDLIKNVIAAHSRERIIKLGRRFVGGKRLNEMNVYVTADDGQTHHVGKIKMDAIYKFPGTKMMYGVVSEDSLTWDPEAYTYKDPSQGGIGENGSFETKNYKYNYRLSAFLIPISGKNDEVEFVFNIKQSARSKSAVLKLEE